MSILTVDDIMKRILIATKTSPIAVFAEEKGLDAVFGATIDTLQKIQHSTSYIGMFHGDMNQEKVRVILEGIK